MSVNTQLRKAMFAAGLTHEQLAKEVRVDPKTVERWITTGRTPYPVHQHRIAEVVGVEEKTLWPGGFARNRRPRPTSENQRLREALFEARTTPEQLAEKLDVAPKTVRQWISQGIVPHQRHKSAAALEIGVPESELWPDPVSAAPQSERSAQVIALRDHRVTDAPESGASAHEPPPGHWAYEVPEGWRRVEETNAYGARYWCLEQEDRRGSTAHAVADGDQSRAGNPMQELMSWVPSDNRETVERAREPIPGHAFAGLVNGHDREGWER